MAKAKAPKWSSKDYTPFYLMEEPAHTIKEIRAEYTRQRDILQKRANRMEAQGLEAQAKYLSDLMPKLGTVQTNEEVAARLAEGHAQAGKMEYSLKGLKQLQKYFEGQTGEEVPLGDVLDFNEYMKSWRLSAFSDSYVISGDAAALYGGDYQDVGGTFSEFYSISYLYG